MGLLDAFTGEDRGLLGLMLLQAAAPKAGGRTGIGEGLLGAFQGLEQRKAAQQDRAMRQQQMDMQRQQQALQLQQMQRQDQQQDTDTAALRGLFQPLPGPTQDGSQLRRGFDPAGMLQAGASPQALQQAMQLDQLVNPRAKPPEFKVVNGSLVRIGGDGNVSEAFRAPEKPVADEFTRALTAAGLDPNSPQARALAMQRLTKMATHAPQTTNVTLGSPVPVTLPDGSQALVQPPNRPGEPPQIMRLPGGDPLRPKKDDKPLTEAQAKAVAFLGQMRASSATIGQIGPDQSSWREQANVAMAGTPANILASEKGQQVRQAQEQWAESFLRFKTGAASTKDEVARNVRTFFPQMGDTAATIAQKARMREQAEADIAVVAGPGAQQAQLVPSIANRSQPAGAPRVGEVRRGYVFKGGDPSQPSSWEKQ